jgi:predicted nucleotidyltransferase
VLFGSRARRDHRERSDFDLGIYGETPVPLQTFYKIGDFLDRIPTLYRIDWVDLNRAAAAVQKNALANAKVIYG